jgi:methylenetetrahydrofolate--tRNA-(uracil-5-)-methyltransferase
MQDAGARQGPGGRQGADDGQGAGCAVVGGGLAGCEAAWQAAQRGLRVTLFEMRPARMTAAHHSDLLAELVCSNSLGSNQPDHASGILKNEMRRLGSLIIDCADQAALPAGSALAVGREEFSRAVTAAILGHANITVRREEVGELPAGLPVIVASGPLTSLRLAETLRGLAGQEWLYFFDAMAPIVTADSVDMSTAFRASRYSHRSEDDALQGDYINCPMSRTDYYAFVEAIKSAEKIELSDFEREPSLRIPPGEGARYFEGCLPIEVLAARHADALAFGPMRPAGLRDPRTGKRPFAVVQLRQDDVAGTLYNLVGFQTNLKWGDQERVLRMVPGLQQAEFVRFGQMHRNTFINSPVLLRPTLQWQGRDDLFLAGQITGTEGYVGSAAGGLLAGINVARLAHGQLAVALPPTTMMGALFHYITHANPAAFQPMKANLGLLPPLAARVAGRRERGLAYAARAAADFEAALRAAAETDLGTDGKG